FFVCITAVWICLTIASLSHSDTIPDKPPGYVVDLAGIVDSDTESKLNSFLAELEQKTTAQLVILTIKSLEGASLEEFSIDIAHNKWKLGQKDKDNGVLFLIALNDRKYRVEVGYGLEGVLPDSRVGSIGRDFLVPFFKNGEFSKGVYTATLVIANDIATDAGVTISGMPSVQNAHNRKPPSLASKIISFIVIIILLIFFIKNPKLFMLFLLFSAMGGRGGSWSGGRGGFGGGGGGGFGGGGSSGGW
ncbi:MAG: TPM domain-containing protein, partial [Desulfobacterales bacterium]|nr:TPM domain-containing protein [Desulfobacterales bacterium]